MENIFKIGDKVRIEDRYLPVTSNWLGEGGNITHQGPYIVEEINESGVITRMSGICVHLSYRRFELYKENLEFVVPVPQTMEEIRKICMEKFPIGCTYIEIGSVTKKILRKDDTTYQIYNNYVYAHNGAGSLYSKGRYVELISLPEDKPIPPEPKLETVEKEINYVGRYLKALINQPVSIPLKKGEYGYVHTINSLDDLKGNINSKSWTCKLPYQIELGCFELMPKGFVPSIINDFKITIPETDPSIKFKVGDWVIGWFNESTNQNYHIKSWEIGRIENNNVYPRINPSHCTDIESIRFPTTEQVERMYNEEVYLEKSYSSTELISKSKNKKFEVSCTKTTPINIVLKQKNKLTYY